MKDGQKNKHTFALIILPIDVSYIQNKLQCLNQTKIVTKIINHLEYENKK